jgi:hypothetical protein
MGIVRIAAGLALLAAVSAPAAAAPRKGEAGYDPNREICKSQSVVGSRLKRIRACHTAQQWEEMKRQEQEGLRRKQYNGASGCNECGG